MLKFEFALETINKKWINLKPIWTIPSQLNQFHGPTNHNQSTQSNPPSSNFHLEQTFAKWRCFFCWGQLSSPLCSRATTQFQRILSRRFFARGMFQQKLNDWVPKVTWVVKSHKLRRWSFGIVWWDLMKLDFLDWRFQRTSLNYAGEDAHVFLCQEYVLDFGISWIVFFRLGMALLVVGRSIKKGDCTHPTPLIQNGQRQGRMGNKNHQACQPMYRPTLRSQCCSSRWMNLYWKLSDCNMTG